jgi:hypothetical protein
VRQLIQQSKHSRDKLYKIINYWLSNPPKDESTFEQSKYLIFDGTYLHRPVGIVALMDARNNCIIQGQYGVSESSSKQLHSFFNPLIERGLNPKSYTVDGNPQVIRVIKTLWPGITIQRCLVHIQRQGLMWCRRYPKTVYARKLRNIFLKVLHIHTIEERDSFLELFVQWEYRYGQHLKMQPEKGKVFSDIKRARSMLLKALPDMFHYLDDPNISFTTNGLEGYFSRLKGHYRQHRGLGKNKLENYFGWCFYYMPK